MYKLIISEPWMDKSCKEKRMLGPKLNDPVYFTSFLEVMKKRYWIQELVSMTRYFDLHFFQSEVRNTFDWKSIWCFFCRNKNDYCVMIVWMLCLYVFYLFSVIHRVYGRKWARATLSGNQHKKGGS